MGSSSRLLESGEWTKADTRQTYRRASRAGQLYLRVLLEENEIEALPEASGEVTFVLSADRSVLVAASDPAFEAHVRRIETPRFTRQARHRLSPESRAVLGEVRSLILSALSTRDGAFQAVEAWERIPSTYALVLEQQLASDDVDRRLLALRGMLELELEDDHVPSLLEFLVAGGDEEATLAARALARSKTNGAADAIRAFFSSGADPERLRLVASEAVPVFGSTSFWMEQLDRLPRVDRASVLWKGPDTSAEVVGEALALYRDNESRHRIRGLLNTLDAERRAMAAQVAFEVGESLDGIELCAGVGGSVSRVLDPLVSCLDVNELEELAFDRLFGFREQALSALLRHVDASPHLKSRDEIRVLLAGLGAEVSDRK